MPGTITARHTLAISLFLIVLIACFWNSGCTGDGNTDDGTAINQPPVAMAGADTVVLPGSTILLHGSGQDTDGEIVKYEWQIEGDSTFVDVINGDTSFPAPGSFDNGIQCILRITDDSGATALDTMRVIVSWLDSPNGGETYRIGDTLHIRLLPCEVQVTLKLVMHYQGDLAEFTFPELDAVQMIWPPSNPVVSVLVRDSLTDRFFGRISLVSDSLRIRVTNYLESGTYVESANTFSIIQ